MDELNKIVKDKLNGLEAPYNPKAWDSLATRLDQTMPIKSSSSKWIWSAATTIAVLGVAGLIYLNSTSHPEVKTITAKEHVKQEKVHSTVEKTINVSSKEEAIKNTEVKPLIVRQQNMQSLDGDVKMDHFEHSISMVSPNPPFIESVEEQKSVSHSLVLPVLKDVYCLNDVIEFQNKNNFDLVIVSANSTVLVPKGQTVDIKLSDKGAYYVSAQSSKKAAFNVADYQVSSFTYDKEMLYDKGLPYYTVNSNTEATSYTWLNDQKEVLASGKSASINLFTKGNHEIFLKTTDSNGCESISSKSIFVESEYNLLAVTGFNPSSTIESNRTFLPFALLKSERNVGFRMEIIDPKTGQVIFETQAADQPWNGINTKTNELVAPNTTFIWKVYLNERVKGEKKSIYQGTITRI